MTNRLQHPSPVRGFLRAVWRWIQRIWEWIDRIDMTLQIMTILLLVLMLLYAAGWSVYHWIVG